MDKKEEIRISVIVPIYNAEEYLVECLDSICQQTYHNLQIILVDDGSTDNSQAICKRYVQKDQRVQYFHKENGGLISARKVGVEKAEGEYVSFIDSDDWIDADMYEVLVGELIEKNKPDLIAFGHIEEYENKKKIINNNITPGYYNIGDASFLPKQIVCTETFFEWKLLPNLCNKLIKRNIIKGSLENTANEIVFGEDAANTYVCVFYSKSILCLVYTPYHYRQRSGSIVRSQNEYEKNNFICLYHALKEVVEESRLKRYLYFCLLLKGYSYIETSQTLFPFEQVKQKSRIFLYGAGGFGKVLHAYILSQKQLQLVGWTDREYKEYQRLYEDICDMESIYKTEFDYIIIAILNEKVCGKIKTELEEKGISNKKILYITTQTLENIDIPSWIIQAM